MTTLTADRVLSGPHPQSDGTTIWIIEGESCPRIVALSVDEAP